MKSSPYRAVPVAETPSPPEIDVTDLAPPLGRKATPGKFIDCLVISDGANLRFPFLHAADNENDDRANMQIGGGRLGGSGRRHSPFTDETLIVDPETGTIVPLVTAAEMTSMKTTTLPPRNKSDSLRGSGSNDSAFSSNGSSDSGGVGGDEEPVVNQTTPLKIVVVFLLFFVNLLNYVDRYTIAGVLHEVMDFYGIGSSLGGLIQTVFIVAYMLFAPVFGYLGDRYNRVFILVFGIAFWSLTTLLGSFVPADYFWVFALLRGAVGVGEASYSTVAPTLIADLFSGKMRTTMLTLFYFAIPVGSGLGYIVGSFVSEALGHWQWALRVTPTLGVVSVALIVAFVREPPRGASDGGGAQTASSSWLKDLRALLLNKSFTLSTLGFTAVCFVSGALAHWTPYLTKLAYEVRGADGSDVALIFGGITVAAGIGGVIAGSVFARMWKVRGRESADALVCAVGLLLCSPFLLAVILCSQGKPWIFWLLVFATEFFLCLNWAVVADILFYVVVPTRRSTAEAFQILISHLFGDAGSPYLIGLVADAAASGEDSLLAKFIPLKHALFMTVVVCALGGGFFLACAAFIVGDKRRAERLTKLNELGVMEAAEASDEGLAKNFAPGVVVDVIAVAEVGRSKDFLLPPRDDRLAQLRNDSQCSTGTANSIESAVTDNSEF